MKFFQNREQVTRKDKLMQEGKSYEAACAYILNRLSSSNCLAVASALPEEGRTTHCIQLGKALAGAGKRVLLIDADLRAPALSRRLQLPEVSGLESYLSGKTAEPAVYETKTPMLFALPAGSAPQNPADLLLSKRLADLLRNAASHYDIVLLDTPPMRDYADAAMLAKLVQGYLLSVRTEYSDLDEIRRAVLALEQMDAGIYGFLLQEGSHPKPYGQPRRIWKHRKTSQEKRPESVVLIP